MTISTMDGVLSGMQRPKEFYKDLTGTMVTGRPHSLWLTNGIPCPGAAASNITGAVLTSTTAGQIPFSNPVSGNTYVARLVGQSTVSGTLLLCDRLWHNAAIDATITTEQTFTSSVQIPARDDNGTTTGDGVFAGVEVLVATTTNTPASMTLKYTNTAGTTGQTVVNITTLAPGSVGDFYPMGIASGDTGIQKAQSLQIAATAWAAGTLGVVLYRVLARVELTASSVTNAVDCLTGGFNKVYNNSVPFLLFIPSQTTTSNITGQVIFTQG